MLDIYRMFDWEPALTDARKGQPAALARLLRRECFEHVPADLRDDIELVLAHPVQARTGGRKPRFDPSRVTEIRMFFFAWTLLDPRRGAKTAARIKLANRYHCKVGTIRDVLEYRGKAYAMDPLFKQAIARARSQRLSAEKPR